MIELYIQYEAFYVWVSLNVKAGWYVYSAHPRQRKEKE